VVNVGSDAVAVIRRGVLLDMNDPTRRKHSVVISVGRVRVVVGHLKVLLSVAIRATDSQGKDLANAHSTTSSRLSRAFLTNPMASSGFSAISFAVVI
jgi:hypothetical protein